MKRNIFKIIIIIFCVFIFTGCNKEKEAKLEQGKDYFVRDEFSGKYLDLTKRGYYIDSFKQLDSPYFYIICMGEKNTGGYSLKVKEVSKVGNQTEIIVEEIVPDKGAIVTMAFTYPTIVVEFPKNQENIVIKNTEGKVFDKLN